MDSQQKNTQKNELGCRTPVIDCFSGKSDFINVIGRVGLASVAFTVASSAFQLALCVSFLKWWWDPPVIIALNILTVIYLVSILVPAALILSWIYRYNQPSPYQQRQISTNFNARQTFDLCLAALADINATIVETDEETGRMIAIRPAHRNARSQEILITLANDSNDSTLVTVKSQARLNPIEALIFGYSLAVDGGENARNVKRIISSLKWHADMAPKETAVLADRHSISYEGCAEGSQSQTLPAICLAS